MFEKNVSVTINVEGMMCMHCVKHVEDALKEVTGVKKVKVELEKNTAQVEYVPSKTNEAELVSAIEKAGYKAAVA